MVKVKEIQLKIPFSTLTSLLEQLEPEDMLKLWELLDEKLFEYEDELMLANPQIMAEIREARAEYEAGGYITLQESTAQLNETEDADVGGYPPQIGGQANQETSPQGSWTSITAAF